MTTKHVMIKFKLPKLIRTKDGWLDTEANDHAMNQAFRDYRRERGPDFGDPIRQKGRCLGYTDKTGKFHPA